MVYSRTVIAEADDIKRRIEDARTGRDGEDSRVVIVIPAYQPPPVLAQLVADLTRNPKVEAIVVVDDGSGPGFQDIFKEIQRSQKTRVLLHAANSGKGAALKTGLGYAGRMFPHCVGVVTADADGQHVVPDILQTARTLRERPDDLVLGSRRFGARMPFRSRLGNAMARWALFLLTDIHLTDTQTGLRGIPMTLVPELLCLKTSGYEFELDMLITSRRSGRQIAEVPVAAVYIDGNRGSHFNPLLDSMRVLSVLLRRIQASRLTVVIDNLVFALAFFISGQVLAAMGVGRLVAGLFHYFSSNHGLVPPQSMDRSTMRKYYLLLLWSGLASYALIVLITSQLTVHVLVAKVMAEAFLCFFNFWVRRDFAFYPRGAEKLSKTPVGDGSRVELAP